MSRRYGSVTDLVVVLGECLSALTPYMSKVGIPWKEPNNYDDWDEIAGAVYSSVVGKTVAYTVEGKGFRKLAPYGLCMPTYAEASFLFSTQFGREAAFVKLVTSNDAFDTVLFISLNAEGKPTDEWKKSALRQTQFFALLRSENGEREIENVILEE